MDALRHESGSANGRKTLLLSAFRATALVAATASAALYAQYLNPSEATFCGLDSGCEAVRRASLTVFDNPIFSVPLLGLVAFATLFGVSFVRRAEQLVAWAAVAGGVVGAALFGIQALVIHAFCWLCLVVDVAAIVLGGVSGAWLRAPSSDAARDPLRAYAWVALLVTAVSSPFAWARIKPEAPVPGSIHELYVPGKLNVVEFADFECPYCRRLHPSLKRVLLEQPADKLHFVRGHVPLPAHEEAKPAARAVICAEAQGLADALADRLVQIDLSPAAIRRAAIEVGVDSARFDSCLSSKKPDERIEADTKRLKAAGMRGLPTTYVGEQRLLGAVSEAKLRDAMVRAARGDDEPGGVGGVTFALGLLALLAGIAWLGRAPHVTLTHEPRS
jgi:predicted DsbA family dithiol-disulfide isomerase/uncharacterized membrane protein